MSLQALLHEPSPRDRRRACETNRASEAGEIAVGIG